MKLPAVDGRLCDTVHDLPCFPPTVARPLLQYRTKQLYILLQSRPFVQQICSTKLKGIQILMRSFPPKPSTKINSKSSMQSAFYIIIIMPIALEVTPCVSNLISRVSNIDTVL